MASIQGSYKKDDFFDQLSCDTLERLAIHDEGECVCKWGDGQATGNLVVC